MRQKSLSEISQDLQNKKYSSQELTQEVLNQIEQYNPELNCMITVTPEFALAQARIADEKINCQQTTKLTGIPIAHKDIFCTKGIKTSCGSKMLDNFISPYHSAVTEKLDQAGMVTVAKTNMDEFAMGSSNETSFYGAVKNPWNTAYVPGGSSGGSAAAVAARMVPAATGTDTGGSIRQPAAFCGITGLKPTYGRVSRFGMIAFASSLDQAGPMTQSAEDAALLLEAMAGFDERDSTSVDRAVPNYSAHLNDSIEGLKIGLPKEYFNQNLNNQVAQTIQTAIKTFQDRGAKIVEISLANTHLSVPAYYVVAPAECSSNLSRFDGVRFGHRCDEPQNLEDLYKRSRSEGFGEEVKRRIMIGTYALSAGYYDAYYLKAQKTRRLISNDFQNAFKDVDVIMGPVAPTPAFKLGEKTNNPIEMYLSDIYTIPVNLAGLPGISIPAGFIDGLPVGLQIISNYFNESQLLNVAHQYQLETDWHKTTPQMA